MAENEKTGKEAARAASEVLRDPNASAAAKSAAGSALTQAPDRDGDESGPMFIESWALAGDVSVCFTVKNIELSSRDCKVLHNLIKATLDYIDSLERLDTKPTGH